MSNVTLNDFDPITAEQIASDDYIYVWNSSDSNSNKLTIQDLITYLGYAPSAYAYLVSGSPPGGLPASVELTGTANQINVTDGVLSTPQNLDTDAATEFGSLKLSNSSNPSAQMLALASSASNPSTGYAKWYVKTVAGTKQPYFRRDDGTEIQLGEAGGTFSIGNDITGGSANRILFESSANKVAEDADLQFDASTNIFTASTAKIGAGPSTSTDAVFINGALSYLDVNAAVRQTNGGATIINAATGQSVQTRINGSTRFTVNINQVTFGQVGILTGRTALSASTLTVGGTDYYIACTGAVSGTTITLQAAATAGTARWLTIKDVAGTGLTRNITINASSGQTIDGASSYVINTAYGSITIVSDGSSNWEIVSKII